jgi:hypothetical protein
MKVHTSEDKKKSIGWLSGWVHLSQARGVAARYVHYLRGAVLRYMFDNSTESIGSDLVADSD